MCASVEQVLAVVENEQDLAIAQRTRQHASEGLFGRLADAQDGRDARRHQRRVDHGTEFDQPHAVAVVVNQRSSDFERKPRLAATANTRQCQQAGVGKPADDLVDGSFATNQACGRQRQVVAPSKGRFSGRRRAVSTHGRNRRLETGLVPSLQLQRGDQSLGRIAIRMCGPAFELLNAVDTQAGALGELLLRQSRRLSIVAELIAKGRRRARREHLSARQRITGISPADPPACTPA